MTAMANCPLPVSVPLSPPPYEEAIRTTGPDVSVNMDTEGNDEPPPSYSEATKDDAHPSEGSEQLNTSDLMELIFPVQTGREQSRRERRSLHPNSSRGADRESEVHTRGHQNQSGHRKKLSVCLLSAGMGVFLIAGLIAASILRHKPNMSSHKTSDLVHMKTVTISPMDRDLHNKIWVDLNNHYDPSHIRINKNFEKKQKQQQSLFDALRKSLQEAHSDRPFIFPLNSRGRDTSTVDPFYEEIRKISEDNSLPTMPPKTDSKDSIEE